MKKLSKLRDSIIVFENPLKMGETNLYGLIYSKAENSPFDQDKRLAKYLIYVLGAIKFLNEGGEITEDGREWTDPKTKDIHYVKSQYVSDYCNNSFGGKTKIYVLETDSEIKYNKDEINDDFIVNPSLISRYVKDDKREEVII